jgi:nucleoid DNA-binding protein
MKAETATKKDLSISIGETLNYQPSAVTTIIDHLMAEIQNQVKSGKAVTLRGLGTFYPKVQLGKPCMDIFRGKAVFSKNKNIVKFRPSALFISKLNK